MLVNADAGVVIVVFVVVVVDVNFVIVIVGAVAGGGWGVAVDSVAAFICFISFFFLFSPTVLLYVL